MAVGGPSSVERLGQLAGKRGLRLAWSTSASRTFRGSTRFLEMLDASGRAVAQTWAYVVPFDEARASEACATQMLTAR